jgi:hypothetical protein
MATLLDYAFSTAPIPLQVNPQGGQATSRINLSVSNPSAAYCSQIMVAVPIGTSATDFCLEPPAASVNTGKWTIASQEVVKGEEIGLGAGTFATITFQCRDQADYQIDYSLVLSLVGVVNSAVGAFVYAVQELSGRTPDDLTPKTGNHTIGKQDAIFTLSNFVATATDKPTVPGTAFGNGQALRLSWESTGTWFELYTKGASAPIYAGPATSYSLSSGLTADAQFVLVASVSGDPSQDSPSPGYQPIYLYDALTLVVVDPDLTAKSVAVAQTLTVTGRSTAVGGLDVGTEAAPTTANIRGKMSVTESVSTGGLAVTGTTSLGSTLHVTGPSTLGSSLTVTGPAALNSTLDVTGKTTLGETAAGVVGAGTVNTNQINVTGGGQVWVDTGNRNGAQVFNTSAQYPVGWFQNRSGRTGNQVTGLVGWVAQGSDVGLYTNGRIAYGYAAALTHLPTRDGHRVVTSALVPEAEVHISGSGRLSDGKARVEFTEDIADLVCYSSHAPYRVLVTPTAQCAGLVVVAKAAGHFVVEEAGEGHSDASFDWIVITRQRADGEASVAMELPTELPWPKEPEARETAP